MTFSKMKITAFILPALASSLIGLPVLAQINLDKPISAGMSDKLFLSTADAGVAYYIPIGLVRFGEAEVYDRDRSSTVAAFNITTAESDLKRVSELLAQTENKDLKVRLYRPLSITVMPGVDLSPNDHPQLTMMSDFSFDGSTKMSITVDSKKSFLRRESSGKTLFNRLFGPKSADNVAIIRYEGIAQAMGQPYRMQGAVGVYVGDKNQSQQINSSRWLSESTQDQAEKANVHVSTASPSLVILDDAQTPCWDKTIVGQICIRK